MEYGKNPNGSTKGYGCCLRINHMNPLGLRIENLTESDAVGPVRVKKEKISNGCRDKACLISTQ
jgi:hypothetical protein